MEIDPTQDTDYNDDYLSCARTYASLRVFCSDLDPDAISEALGAQPSRSYRIGDSVGRQGATRKTNMWLLSSEEGVA